MQLYVSAHINFAIYIYPLNLKLLHPKKEKKRLMHLRISTAWLIDHSKYLRVFDESKNHVELMEYLQ
jgi:hypothetical protein